MFLALPDDVIRYELMPYLDYISRLNLNLAMPKSYQVVKRLDKSSIYNHEFLMLHRIISARLDKCTNEYRRNKQIHLFIGLFSLFYNKRFNILLTSNLGTSLGFRAAYKGRLMFFSNGNLTSRRDEVSLRPARRLAKICRDLLSELDKIEMNYTLYKASPITII
jgi:hypothetical protein